MSFRYPETSSLVLRDVSIRLRFGTTVAIVGQNGAGKTTLVKLLCRMYEPTEGRILIDGVPLSEIEPESWLSRITAAFQDFARLEVTARETIGVGDLGRMDDRAAIASAISRADAADVIDSLPAGVDTALRASWEGGYEPSIGQWQKLAIARCAMPEGPGASRRDRIT